MKLYPFLVLSCVFISSVLYAQKTDKRYINDDVTAIYSTHVERPFRYGKPYTSKEIWAYYRDNFEGYEIDSGMVVAEVGAASGWIQGIFSVFSENVTYYVQDIDTHFLNRRELDAVIEHFSNQRTTAQTNTFEMVIGTEQKTNLPDATFDLIILNNTFHEIDEPDFIIQDLAKKLKPKGRVVIRENFSNESWEIKHAGCGITAYDVNTIEDFFALHGMYLTKTYLPEFSKVNFLTFEKSESKGRAYRQQQESLTQALENLKALHDKKVLKDGAALEDVKEALLEDLPELLKTYPHLVEHFHDLAEYYLDKGKENRALEVLNVLDALFPNDPVSPIIRGDVLFESYLLEEAIDAYQRAVTLDTTEVSNYANLMLSFTALSQYEDGLLAYEAGREMDSTDDYLSSVLGYLFAEMESTHYFPYRIRNGQLQKQYSTELGSEEEALDFALAAYSEAIALQPLDPDYYESRSDIYMRLSMFEKAIEDYNRILYLDPYRTYIYRYRARAKEAMGDQVGHDADLAEMKRVRKELKK